MNDLDQQYMRRALALAHAARDAGEVPVGALLVQDDGIVAEGMNRCILDHDPTAHAEIVAMRRAGLQLLNYRLPRTTLYVTLEPCAMCFGALVHARVERVVFAASDPKSGALSVVKLNQSAGFNHRIQIDGGLFGDESRALLQAFFQSRR